jgi:hypothetical protein
MGDPETEYQDVSENLRHCDNFGFALFSAYTAITGGLLALLYAARDNILPFWEASLKVVGLALSLIFLIMAVRLIRYYSVYCRRVVRLEEVLGYRQYTERQGAKHVRARWALIALCFLLIVFWLGSLFLSRRFWRDVGPPAGPRPESEAGHARPGVMKPARPLEKTVWKTSIFPT